MKVQKVAQFVVGIVTAGLLLAAARWGMGSMQLTARAVAGCLAAAWLGVHVISSLAWLLRQLAGHAAAAAPPSPPPPPPMGWDPEVCLLVTTAQNCGDELPSIFRGLGYSAEVIALSERVGERYRVPPLGKVKS